MSTRLHLKHGFTLLELLVVVAVIALLLAILLPALALADAAGRGALCGTNMNQLGQASLVYSEKNDSYMPWYRSLGWEGPEREGEWWVTQLARGMEVFEPKIYRCPSDPVPLQVPVYLYNGVTSMHENADREDRLVTLKVSYCGFCTHTIVGSGGWSLAIRRITEFARPDKALQLIEKNVKCLGVLSDAIRTGKSKDESWQRHLGATNVLFFDGHVERMNPVSLGTLSLAWKKQLKPSFWGRDPRR